MKLQDLHRLQGVATPTNGIAANDAAQLGSFSPSHTPPESCEVSQVLEFKWWAEQGSNLRPQPCKGQSNYLPSCEQHAADSWALPPSGMEECHSIVPYCPSRLAFEALRAMTQASASSTIERGTDQ